MKHHSHKFRFLPFLIPGAVFCLGLSVLLCQSSAPFEADAASAGMVKTVQTGLGDRQLEIEVYRDESGVYYLADYLRNIVVFDGSDIRDFSTHHGDFHYYVSSNGVFNDPTAVTLFYNCVQTYDAYASGKLGFELNGINGRNDKILNNADANGEITLYAIAHLNDRYYRYNAAFSPEWSNGKIIYGFMLVGDGNPPTVEPEKNYYHMYQQARSLDTIGHEYQHGVTRNIWSYSSSTSGDYGAVNEAVSDIFGMLIENLEENVPLYEDSWDNGTKATYDGTPLFSMRKPEGYYRSDFSKRYTCNHSGPHTDACDQGWVHYNSTILTNAQYEAWKKMPDYFTPERIGKLWYEAIHHIKPNSTLEDFAVELLRAAETNGFDQTAVDAFKEVFSQKGLSVHNVLFRNEDGTILKRDYARHGGAASPPSDTPEKESVEPQYFYTFDGWEGGDISFVNDDVTFTAKYVRGVKSFYVRYYVNGALWKTEKQEYGDLTLPQAPDGVEGWYFDETFSRSAEGAQLTEDIDLYGKPRKYKIELYVKGELWKTEEQEYGKLTLPQLPDGAEGWYLDGEFNKAAQDVRVEGDMSLYAKLRKYRINFFIEGKLWKSEQQEVGSIVLPSADGVEGWYLDEDFKKSAENAQIVGDMAVYAKSASRLGLILGITIPAGAVLLAGAAAAAIFFSKKRKKKD